MKRECELVVYVFFLYDKRKTRVFRYFWINDVEPLLPPKPKKGGKALLVVVCYIQLVTFVISLIFVTFVGVLS